MLSVHRPAVSGLPRACANRSPVNNFSGSGTEGIWDMPKAARSASPYSRHAFSKMPVLSAKKAGGHAPRLRLGCAPIDTRLHDKQSRMFRRLPIAQRLANRQR